MTVATKTKTLKIKPDSLWFNGGVVALQTAKPAEGADANAKPVGPDRFQMVLYTGACFAGHWLYGDVYVDLAGVKPSRQDIPAFINHRRDQTVGWTDALKTVKGEFIVEGQFLQGDAEQEPDAAQVRSRLAQKFPYQCSGYWLPLMTEEVQKGVAAKVNGQTVTGPCTIFRQSNLREVSFCELGLDENTQAVAASAGEEMLLTVQEVSGTEPDQKGPPMPDPTKPALLTQLQGAFGPEKAIALFTANPSATGLEAFTTQLVEELTGLRTKLTTAEGEIATLKTGKATLETELAAAKKAPAVITASGDPQQPTPPAATPAGIAAMAEGPDKWKLQYASDPAVKAEFSSEANYLAYKGNESNIHIVGGS